MANERRSGESPPSARRLARDGNHPPLGRQEPQDPPTDEAGDDACEREGDRRRAEGPRPTVCGLGLLDGLRQGGVQPDGLERAPDETRQLQQVPSTAAPEGQPIDAADNLANRPSVARSDRGDQAADRE